MKGSIPPVRARLIGSDAEQRAVQPHPARARAVNRVAKDAESASFVIPPVRARLIGRRSVASTRTLHPARARAVNRVGGKAKCFMQESRPCARG